MNLVRKITLNGNVLEYYYDAAGTKHQMGYSKPSDPTKNETTRYVGSMEWLGIHLKRIATGEGQVIFYPPTGAAAVAGTQGGLWVNSYQYYLTDHLGNTRVVVNDSGRVLQKTDYYAFGLAIDVVDRGVNKYTYNGKELQPETGLLDYGARQYDAAVGRWFGIDPMAEANEDFSTYLYAANNPIINIDFLGLTDINGDGVDDGISLEEVVVKGKRESDNENTLNNVQLALDGIGLIPGAGTVAGIANASIDIYRGNYGSAGLNLVSAIPFLGSAIKGVKVAAMTTKVVSSMAKMKVVKSALAITYRNMKSISGFAKHHVIPQALLNKYGDEFAEAGFNIHAGDNIRYLENGFHTKHNAYTEVVAKKLQNIMDANNGKLTMGEVLYDFT